MLSSDAKALRKTIRLIHCLQKERGATCTAAAALGSVHTKSPDNTGSFRDASKTPEYTSFGTMENVGHEKTVKHKSISSQPDSELTNVNIGKNTKMFVDFMQNTRLKTDRALADMAIQGTMQGRGTGRKSGAPFREALIRIRKMVTTDPGAKSATDLPQSRSSQSTSNFRRVFMAFNALIVHIIHEKIVMVMTFQRSISTTSRNEPSFQGNRARADTSPNKPSENGISPAPFNRSGGESQKQEVPNKVGRRGRMAASADANFYEKIFLSMNKSKDGNSSIGKEISSQPHKHSARKPPLPVNTNRAHNDEEKEKEKEKSSSVKNQFRSRSLLSLLLSFVQLKESTSVERAFLTSLLSLSENAPLDDVGSGVDPTENGMNVDLPATNIIGRPKPMSRRTLSQDGEKLVNDMVMEMETQHLMVRKLRKRAREVEEADLKDGYRWSISKLVEESVEMSPELAELHNLIRMNFDVQAFCEATTTERFWDMITLYIDRLHALELLIVEEIETCAIASPAASDVPAVLSITAAVSADELPVSDPETAPSPAHSLNSSRASSVENEPAVFDRSLLLSALSDEKDANTFDISPNEAQKVLESMAPSQLKQCILSMFGGTTAMRNQPDDDIFSLSDDGSLFENVATQPAPEPDIPTEIEIKENAVEEPPHKEWMIDLYQVSFIKRIGRGCAGTTYIGKWQNQPVAIKVAAMTQMGVDGWGTEVRSLQRLHHPNIIRFFGAIYNDHPRTHCLVLEYCDCGDLSQALQMELLPRNFFEKTASSMANGMAYLHTKNILHRDIKPGNVLIHGDLEEGDFMIKLTDFGLATMSKSEDDEHTAETGTYRWMAPEVIRHESYSYEADVYSFSVVVWQLITREVPFSGYSQVQAATMVAIDHARPPFPHGMPRAVQSLIAEGWNNDVKVRPSFESIVKKIQEFRETLTEGEKEWLQEGAGHSVYAPQQPEIHQRAATQKNAGRKSTATKRRNRI